MSIRTKILISFLFIAILIAIGGYFSFSEINKSLSSFKNNIPQSIDQLVNSAHLDNLAQLIRYYDEFLTQSARNYSFTSDPKWKERYKEGEGKLDLIIKEAIKEGDNEEKQFFSKINDSNIALVAMEHHSMELVDAGDFSEAIKILESEEYSNQKKIYSENLDNYINSRNTHYDEAILLSTKTINSEINQHDDLMKKSIRLMTFFVIFIFIITLFLGNHISLLVSRPIKKISKVAEKISAGDFNQKIESKSKDEIGKLTDSFNKMATDLKELYFSLDQKVKERTIKLSEEKAKAEALLNSIGDGVIAVNTEGKVIFANKSAFNLLGYTREEAEGKFLNNLVKIEDEKGNVLLSERRPIKIALSTGKTTTTDVKKTYYYVGKNKIKFPVAIIVTPVILNKKIIGAIDAFRDISSDKNIDKMKTEFVSLVSHQLKTPLTVIRWFAEMLGKEEVGKLSKKQKEYLDMIFQSNRQMIKLVNNLLNVSRLESGRIRIEPKQAQLENIIQDVISKTDTLRKERKCKIIFIKPKQKLPLIPLDESLIRQIFLNLITNSIRYSKPKGGEISIKIEKRESDFLIEVADNGIGIPSNYQDKIFQKFYRADNAKKIEPGGSGLGLYLVKLIIEAASGKVWFKSEEGKGTIFYVSIPLQGMKEKQGEKPLEIEKIS